LVTKGWRYQRAGEGERDRECDGGTKFIFKDRNRFNILNTAEVQKKKNNKKNKNKNKKNKKNKNKKKKKTKKKIGD
jgi:hypothetical protein